MHNFEMRNGYEKRKYMGIVTKLSKNAKKNKNVMSTLQEALEQANRELSITKKKLEESSILYEVSQAVLYTLDYQELLQCIMESLFKIVEYDICASLLFDKDTANITVKPAYPQSVGFVKVIKNSLIDTIFWLIGENIIHLPTIKTHVFTSMTGAMKNAFGGLLNEKRHWTHSVIHETLADLLMIQKEIHPGIFAVMDGTVAGSGPGPRCMNWHLKNIILASSDQVAIDAVAAKIMGFDPMKLGFIRSAHERGLGCGRLNEIDVVGEDISELNWHFRSGNTLASHGQHSIYHGIFKPFEKLFLRTPLVILAYIASWAYHDWYWYTFIGRKRVAEFMRTPWGKMFQRYGKNGDRPLFGPK